MFGAMVTFAVLGIASGTLLAWLDGVPSATWLEEAALVLLDALLGFALWWGISGFTLTLHTITVESERVERYGAIPAPLPRSVTLRCIAKATHPGLWLPLGLLVTFCAT